MFGFKRNNEIIIPEEIKVERLDTRRIPEPDDRPLHVKYLEEMDMKRRELLSTDAELVRQINDLHRRLASTRMALRGVEDMMSSIKANPVEPMAIKSITQFREEKKHTESTAVAKTIATTPSKVEISEEDLRKAIIAEITEQV